MRSPHRIVPGASGLTLLLALRGLSALAALAALSVLAASADQPTSPPSVRAAPSVFPRVRTWPANARVPAWVEPLARRAARVSAHANVRQAGPESLWFELLEGKAPWFPYLTAPFDPVRLRFANFGAGGLLVGEIASTAAAAPGAAEAYAWVALHAPAEPAPLAETVGFADGRGPAERSTFRYFADATAEGFPERLAGGPAQIATALSAFWSGGLGCYAAGRGLSKAPGGFDCDPTREPADGRVAACLPVASRRTGALEVVRPAPGSGSACYFQRAPVDDRFDFGAADTRLACVNETGGLAFPSLDAATALFPTSAPGVYLAYEPLYSPPKVSVLELGTATVRPGASASLLPFEARARGIPPRGRPSGPAKGGASGGGGLDADLPTTSVAQGFEGLYACERSGEKEWYFIDTDLFEGRRAPTPSDDRAFRVVVKEAPSTGPFAARLEIGALEWDEVASEVPGLDMLPTAGCVLAPAIDLRCALKIVRLTGQMALEIHAGAWDDALDPQVRWGAFGAALGSLAEVGMRAPRFALAPEVERLRAFFQRELEVLRGAHPEITGEPWWAAPNAGRSGSPRSGRTFGRPDEGERAKLLSLLGLPSTLWTDLGEPTGRSGDAPRARAKASPPLPPAGEGPATGGENETSGDGPAGAAPAIENGDER